MSSCERRHQDCAIDLSRAPLRGPLQGLRVLAPDDAGALGGGLADALYTVRAYRAQIDTPADGVQTLDAGRSASEMEVAL